MIRSVLIAAVLLFTASCVSVNTARDRQIPSDIPVYFLDDSTATSITFLNHRAERLPSGHLSIAFTCRGTHGNEPVVIDWKVVFFDGQGMPLEETEWHTEYLSPGEVKMFQAGSIRTDSAAFQLQMRTPSGVK